MKNLTDELTFRHGATTKNLLVQSPMLTNSGINGKVSDDTLDYWKARSNSAGLMITEYNYVSKNGGPALTWADDRTQLAVYDDSFIPGLTKLAKTMKSHGNKAILQIAHTGREANYHAIKGEKIYGPDSADYPFLPYKVTGLTTEEVDQIVQDFGDATRRAIKAGFDGVEIHGANHYLIQQFFSAFSNHRDDKYGKKDAFPMAVAKAVFEAVKEDAPKDFIVGYRFSPEEINPTNIGYTWHEATKLIDKLTKQFDFDYIHISEASYNAKPTDSDKTFAEIFVPYINNEAKEIIVGNIMDKTAAKDAVQSSDLIAIGRAQIIDANFSAKVASDTDEKIISQVTDQEEIDEKFTHGLREVMNKETNQPDWQPVLKTLHYPAKD